jgi:rod shape-determining protein MreC
VYKLGWLSRFASLIHQSLYPITYRLYRWNIVQDARTNFGSWEEVRSRYESAQSALESCQVKTVTLDLLTLENETLREQLLFFKKRNFEHVGGEIVGKVAEPITNSLIINRGARDGVKVGDPVIVGDGILVGKISRAEYRSSHVRLLTDNQSKIAAAILNREKSVGIVEGGYDISIQMNFIPQNEIVAVGDMVVTSGLEPTIPRGLLIGRVEAVKKEAYQPFQQAVLTPATLLNRISLVSVLISSTTPTISTR